MLVLAKSEGKAPNMDFRVWDVVRASTLGFGAKRFKAWGYMGREVEGPADTRSYALGFQGLWGGGGWGFYN